MTSFCTHWQFTLECDALFQNKINDSYLNQEYSVLGNSDSTLFIVYLFIVLFAKNSTNQIKSNYLNFQGEEAQEKPPGL